MRILFVHNSYRSGTPSGENRVVDDESALLSSAGHDVESFGVSSDVIDSFGPLRRAMVPTRVIWAPDAKRDLSRTLSRFRPDLVHIHNTFPLLSPSVLAATRAASVPVVATLHNYRLVCAAGTLFRDGEQCHECLGTTPLSGVRHGCYRGSSIMTLPSAASIVFNTSRWKRDVSTFIALSQAQAAVFAQAGFPAERIVVKPNFVRDRPRQVSVAQRHFLYLGRLAEEKGIRSLREAWTRHRPTEGFRHPLVIAGNGPLEGEVRSWADIDPTVRFLGHQSPESCAQLLDEAVAVVVPSVWEETFGLVVVEAKVSAVPSVATNHASFPDLIQSGWDGLLVEPGDAAGLAAAIATLDADLGQGKTMGAAARRSYEQRFTPERNLVLLEAIYDDAMRIHRREQLEPAR